MVISQLEAHAMFAPLIEERGRLYSKFAIVEARVAVPGEVIVTETADGIETHNVAIAGDVVVRNGTRAKEQYILSVKKLSARYVPLAQVGGDGVWGKHQSVGKCYAMRYEGPNTEFVASWGETMVLKTGDMICTTFPDQSEVYRIARSEFEQTYR